MLRVICSMRRQLGNWVKYEGEPLIQLTGEVMAQGLHKVTEDEHMRDEEQERLILQET
jgi:hypothetical protein